MTVKVRFAPSPTGLLHVGNVRTALINWLFARHFKGTFLLRLDDTDQARGKAEYADAIFEDLTWLGIDHDDFKKQSDRLSHYQTITNILQQKGRLYPCYETTEELDFKRKRLLSQGKPPLYDRSALQLSPEEIQRFQAQGRKPHWRFLLSEGNVHWNDLCHGTVSFDAAKLSDPILIREDESPVYTLSSVIDDIDFEITHILRGDDHITNTAIQIQLIEAISGKENAIQFGHFPLIVGQDGSALSKRLGSLSIRQLREEDFEPIAINTSLAYLGSSHELGNFYKMDDLIQEFNIHSYGQSSPKFSLDAVGRMNEKILHHLSYEEVKSRLCDLGLDIDAFLWDALKGNLVKFKDIVHFYEVCRGHITPIIDDHEYIQIAENLLPESPWDESTWKEWTRKIQSQTGKKGKGLFMPLRLALTGDEHGPEMKTLLPLIGRERVLDRLKTPLT